jgi:hypothetical protein
MLRCVALALALFVIATSAAAYDLDPGPGAHLGAAFCGDEVGARDFEIDVDHSMSVFSYFHPLRERLLYEASTIGCRSRYVRHLVEGEIRLFDLEFGGGNGEVARRS